MTSIKKTLSVATVLATISGFAYATSAGEYAKLPGKNWLGYGGDAGQQRYHPSDGINVSNAKNLNVKWIHQHGEKLGSHETTPVIEDGIMYYTTPYNHVFAVDAKTGKELWQYTHKNKPAIYCCGPNSRGVALLKDKVIFATLDAMLVALDKKTGKLAWEKQIADNEAGYSQTHTPAVYKDKIIMGMSGAEYGIRGFISAYNVDDGKLAWKWYTVPSPTYTNPDGLKGWNGDFVNVTDPGIGDEPLNRDIAAEKAAIKSGKHDDAWKVGGASAWMTGSVDHSEGSVYFTTGNPSPDLDGLIRPGDNRWSDALVKINANNGKLIWAYQYIRHDVWDLDSVSAPILADVKYEGGKMVKGVIHGGKTGWTYVHAASDGHLIRRSKEMIPHENLFALPTSEGTRMLPGANGGVEWSPGAFSPKTRLVYYVNLHQPMNYITHSAGYQKGKLWLGSAFVAIPGEKQWGRISAVNVDTAKIEWEVDTAERMIGGGCVTGGDVFFAGEANGYFRAYNAKTGKKLWEFQTGAGANAACALYELGGKLHVAVASGGNAQINAPRGDNLLVFTVD